MLEPATRPLLLTLYQLSVLVGIALLPLAILANQIGITLPFARVIRRLESNVHHDNQQPPD